MVKREEKKKEDILKNEEEFTKEEFKRHEYATEKEWEDAERFTIMSINEIYNKFII